MIADSVVLATEGGSFFHYSSTKNHMKKILLTITGIVAMLIAPTFAHAIEGRWVGGYGQGTSEYFVDKQGMRLYIACTPNEGDSQSGVSLSKVDSANGVKSFQIKVGGMTFDAPFETESRVGSNNFHALLAALRDYPATVIYQGKTIVFAVTGAAAVIPAGTKTTMCKTF